MVRSSPICSPPAVRRAGFPARATAAISPATVCSAPWYWAPLPGARPPVSSAATRPRKRSLSLQRGVGQRQLPRLAHQQRPVGFERLAQEVPQQPDPRQAPLLLARGDPKLAHDLHFVV